MIQALKQKIDLTVLFIPMNWCFWALLFFGEGICTLVTQSWIVSTRWWMYGVTRVFNKQTVPYHHHLSLPAVVLWCNTWHIPPTTPECVCPGHWVQFAKQWSRTGALVACLVEQALPVCVLAKFYIWMVLIHKYLLKPACWSSHIWLLQQTLPLPYNLE